MLNIVKGIINRIVKNKTYLLMAFVVTPIVIISAVYFNDSSFSKPNIAVSGEENINLDQNKVNIIRVDSPVTKSELVRNKYDAVVYFSDGQVTIDSIKSEEFVSKVEDMIEGKNIDFDNNDKRGPIGNIVAFMVMFMFFLGSMLYKYYFDEKGWIFKRIIISNISYAEYIASHFIAVFIMIELPVLIITILVKYIFNLEPFISVLQITAIITALSMLSASFGMFIASIVESSQSASTLGAMVNLITTITSGCFFTIADNGIMYRISNVLPQKNILDITIYLEKGLKVSTNSILNVAVIITILIIASFSINIYKMNKYA